MDEKYLQSIYADFTQRYGEKNMIPYNEFSHKLSSDSAFARQTYDDLTGAYGKDNMVGFDDFYTKTKATEPQPKPVPTTTDDLPAHYEKQQSLIDKLVPVKQPKVTGDIQTMKGVLPLGENMQDKSIAEESHNRSVATKELKSEAAVNTIKRKYKNLGIPVDIESKAFKNDVDLTKKSLDKGDIVVTHDKEGSPTTTRSAKLVEALINTLVSSIKAPIDAYKINKIDNRNDLADQFDHENATQPDVPESIPAGWSGKLGEILGGSVKPAATLAINAIPGAELVGTGLFAAETAATSLAQKKRELYNKFKDQFINEGQPEHVARLNAAQKALDDAGLASIPEVVTNLALVHGIKNGEISPEYVYQNPATQALKKTVNHFLGGTAKMGAIGGVAKGAELAVEKAQGLKISPEQAGADITGSMGDYAAMHAALEIATKPLAFPKAVVAAAKEVLHNAPPEVVAAQGPEVASSMNNYAQARAKVPEEVSPENMPHYAGLIEKQDAIQQKIKDLEESKKAVHPSFHGETNDQIEALKTQSKAIDGQLEKMAKSPNPGLHEVDELTGEKPVDIKNVVKAEPEKPYESNFPKPQLPLDKMTSEQLHDYSKQVKDHSKNQEVEFFGEDGAKEYREAQSVSNSFTASSEQRQQAYKTIDRYEKSLSPQQENEFFAINAPEGLIYDHTEIRDLANRVRIVEEAENLDELATSAKNAMTQLDEKKPSVESSAILNAIRKRSGELDIKPEDLIKEVLKKTGNDYEDANDAEFMMRDLINKLKSNTPNTENLKTENHAPELDSAAKMGSYERGNKAIGGQEEGSGVGQGNELQELTPTRSGQNEPTKQDQPAPTEVSQKEVAPIKEFVSKNGHKLTSENGVVEVVKKNGEPVSRGTKKKVIREAANSYDFTQGQEAPEPKIEPTNDEEYKRHVVENTTSPSELAKLYVNEQPEKSDLSTKEQMIADFGLGKVTEDSYRSFADRNNQNQNKARAYFSKDGTPIDVAAKELSDHYGIEISPEDVVKFIDRFPNGVESALAERESKTAIAARDRFSELTGLPLDNEIAKIAIDQQFNKLSAEERSIATEDYETRKQLEEEYWKHFDTNGPTKEGVHSGTEQAETRETVDPTKPITNRERAEEIAKQILSYRSDNSKLYGGIAGVTTAIYDGMLSTAANIVRAGGSIMDAIDAALTYVRSNSPNADIEKVKQFLHERFKVPYTKPTATPNHLMQGVDVADTGARLHELDKARERIESGVKEKKLSLWDKFSKLAIDTQHEMLKRLGEMGKKGQTVRDYLITTKGSTAKADAMFDQAKEAIYGGMDGFKKVMIGGEQMRVQSLLNKVITLKRTIDIDKKMLDKFNEFQQIRSDIAKLKAANPADPKILKLTNDLDNARDYLNKNGVLKYDKSTGDYSLGQYKHPFGYTSDFAKTDLANIEKEHPELFKQLDARSNLLSDTFHKLIDLKEEAGILSTESADALREYYYAPRADIDNFINSETDNNTKPGQAVKDRQGIKALKGGTENLNEDNYDIQLHKAVSNTMRDISLNNAGKKLLDAVRADKNNKYMYENTPQIYSVGRKAGQLVRDKYGNIQYDAVPSGKAKIKIWDKGRPVEIVADQRLVDSWYDVQNSSGFVQSLGRLTGAQVLRGAITGYNPGFGIFQLLVDPQSAVVASGLYKSYVGGLVTIYKDMAKVAPGVFSPHGVKGVAAEARDYGAFTSFSRGEDVLNLRSDVDVSKRKALRALKTTAEAFNWINDRAENLTRTALYARSKDMALAKYKKINGIDAAGQDLEDIKVQAAHDARRYVDFARGGEYAKEANKIFPYLNAAIQLKRSVISAAAKDPIRIATMTGEAVAAGLGVMAYSLGLGWASHGLSDEEKRKRIEAYRNVNQVTRSKYFLMYKGEDKDGKPQFWRVEKPMILNVAINAAERGMLDHYYKDVDFNHVTTAQDLLSLSPIDQSIVSRNPSLNAVLKGFGNKDWYFNKDVVKNADQITDYLEGTDNKKTKDFYIWLGKKAKDAGVEGGISPMRTQAAVEAYIGDPTQNPIVNLLTSTMAISMDLALGNKKALDQRLQAFKEADSYLNFTTMPKRLIVQPADISIEDLKEWKERGQIKADAKVIRKAQELDRDE